MAEPARPPAEVDVGHTLATGQIILGLMLIIAIVFSTSSSWGRSRFPRQGLRTDGKWGFIVFFSRSASGSF